MSGTVRFLGPASRSPIRVARVELSPGSSVRSPENTQVYTPAPAWREGENFTPATERMPLRGVRSQEITSGSQGMVLSKLQATPGESGKMEKSEKFRESGELGESGGQKEQAE